MRSARGVTRKGERTALRIIREQSEAGHCEPARVQIEAYREAAKAAFQGDTALRPWEVQTVRRQAQVRGDYLAQAQVLMGSADAADRALGTATLAFVSAMPAPDTQRLALARELRDENERLRGRSSEEGRGREHWRLRPHISQRFEKLNEQRLAFPSRALAFASDKRENPRARRAFSCDMQEELYRWQT